MDAKNLEPTVLNHLSYSACRAYSTSPYGFKRSYIERQDFRTTWPFALGKAWHKGLELFFNGDKDYIAKAMKHLDEMIEEGLYEFTIAEDQEAIDKLNEKIETDRENLPVFLAEYPATNRDWNVLRHEDRTVTELSATFPSPVPETLPLKCITDVWDGDYNPTDHKYVSAYTAPGAQDKYFVQSWFNYHATIHIWGVVPTLFRVSEWKKTRNACELSKVQVLELLAKAGVAYDKKMLKPELLQLAIDNGLYKVPSQLKEIVVIYDQKWLDKVSKYYGDTCKMIHISIKHDIWTPNPFQLFGGEDWKQYLNS